MVRVDRARTPFSARAASRGGSQLALAQGGDGFGAVGKLGRVGEGSGKAVKVQIVALLQPCQLFLFVLAYLKNGNVHGNSSCFGALLS